MTYFYWFILKVSADNPDSNTKPSLDSFVFECSVGEGGGDRIEKCDLEVFAQEHPGGHLERFPLCLEVEECDDGCADGLDHVEEDEELELDGLFTVRGGGDLFLVVAPC